RDARLLVFTGRTGRWKGIFAVHSWIVFKGENAARWTRYDVVGWGQPVRTNGWVPDGRWFGDTPRVLVDVRGEQAKALIPRVEGIEFNFLGLVAGIDLRHPGVKLPGFGRLGIDDGSAIAAPASVTAK